MNKHMKSLEGAGGITWQNPAPDASPVRFAETTTASLGLDNNPDLMTEALAEEMEEALAQPYDLPTMVESKRKLFQRAIDKERTEKARQQALVVAAQREIRHLTASIRSLEDALDGLLVSEVA